jgi:predicted ATP-grasp superfamily ATP-dependent carboligase
LTVPRLRNPAIVPNPGTAGVGLIHALSLGGIDIVTVGRTWPPLLGRFSRIPKRHFSYRAERETLAQCLLRIAGELDGTGVLFPAIDVDLEAILLAQDELSQRYHVPAAPHIGADIFAKNWQYDLARRVAVPIPASIKFIAGVEPDLAGLRFPYIIKPSSRTEAVGGRAFRLQVVDDRAQLDTFLAELAREHAGREFQLAENIPGDPTHLYTVGAYANRQGRVLRTYTGRKLSQRPYTHGDASIAETLTVPDVVVRQARALLEEARFHGISQVEFKYDARDDQYKLLEINGRAWSWIKLPAFSGVNLPLIQYYDLTNDPRLDAALASPQRDNVFFVRDALVTLNKLDLERRHIAELSRTKTRIGAVPYESDPVLNAVHSAALLAMRITGRPLIS